MSVPTVYLARHGETAWSKFGRHTGRSDVPLTASGEDDARRLGARLAGTGPMLGLAHADIDAFRPLLEAVFAGAGELAWLAPDRAYLRLAPEAALPRFSSPGVALGGDVFSLNMDNVKTILGAAVAAAVMFLYNYLSKGFSLYGNGSNTIVVTGQHEVPADPAPAQPVDNPVDTQDPPPGA